MDPSALQGPHRRLSQLLWRGRSFQHAERCLTERDYTLGTHDAEIERLGLQHRIWRSKALDAWRRAGITVGQTVLDLGAGPGYAALDLAEIVGPTGKVIAIERSRRFLEALSRMARERGLGNIQALEQDLLESNFGGRAADGAWCRWVLSFVRDPGQVVRSLRAALKSGAAAVFHEYVDYRAWSLVPGSAVQQRFVQQVIDAWRADGGEPNVAGALLRHLNANGFRIEHLQLHVEIIGPQDYFWQWPSSFIEVGTERMVSLGRMTPEQAQELKDVLAAAEADPQSRMITPIVLEVIARAG